MFAARLTPDRTAARQAQGTRIAEPAHAAKRPEVVVERTVLLHVDDHMLDIRDRTAGVVGGNGHRLADARRQRAEPDARAQTTADPLQEISPIPVPHDPPPNPEFGLYQHRRRFRETRASLTRPMPRCALHFAVRFPRRETGNADHATPDRQHPHRAGRRASLPRAAQSISRRASPRASSKSGDRLPSGDSCRRRAG